MKKIDLSNIETSKLISELVNRAKVGDKKVFISDETQSFYILKILKDYEKV